MVPRSDLTTRPRTSCSHRSTQRCSPSWRTPYGTGSASASRYGEQGEPVEADPHRLVSWQQRWYLVARQRPDGAWRAYRADWLRLQTPGGNRFEPVALQGGDYAAFVMRDVAFHGWKVHARISVDAPASEVLARINPTVGLVETIDEQRCVLVTGGDSIEIVAVWIGMLDLDFHVTAPPALVEHIEVLRDRYNRALPSAP